MQGIQNSVAVNAVKRTPEQLAKALAVAQAEVEALKERVGQLQGGGGGGTCVSAAALDCGRARMSSGRRWALVGTLQLAGLAAYFAAAARLGCA